MLKRTEWTLGTLWTAPAADDVDGVVVGFKTPVMPLITKN